MMKKIVKDPKLEEALLVDGYFVIKNFLKEEVVVDLDQYYNNIRPDKDLEKYHFYATTFSQDSDFRKKVKDKIVESLTPSIQEFFYDYKHLGGNFILKVPSNDSELIVHQDTDLIDENQFMPVNIWCPLTDVNVNNGTLHLIPGSHRFYDIIRTPAFPYPYLDFIDKVIGHMVPIEVNKCDAVIFNSSIIHYSPENLSGKERVVADTFISHKDAFVRVHHIDLNKSNAQVEQISQTDDFLETFKNFRENVLERPATGKTIKFFDYSPPKSTPKEFDLLMQKYSNFKSYQSIEMGATNSKEVMR